MAIISIVNNTNRLVSVELTRYRFKMLNQSQQDAVIRSIMRTYEALVKDGWGMPLAQKRSGLKTLIKASRGIVDIHSLPKYVELKRWYLEQHKRRKI